MAVSLEDFLKANLGQLMSIGLPEDLYFKLYEKLYPELVYDAGDFFIFSESESGKEYKLCAKSNIKKESDVFLIDHAWTSDGGAMAKKQLEKMPQLVSRMQALFGLREFNDDPELGKESYLDSTNVIKSICDCSLEEASCVLTQSKDCLVDAILNIQHGSQIKQAGDDSAICSFEEFKKAMQTCAPELNEAGISDDYFLKLYANFRKQQGKGIGAAMTSKYNWADNKEDGLVEVNVAIKPDMHKDKVRSQLTHSHWQLDVEGMGTLISGQLFENVVPSESWWAIESPGVLSMYLKKGQSYGNEWLELIKGEKQLSPKEIEEAAWLAELQCTAEVKDVLDGMWAFNQTYRLGSSKSSPAWYIMDEVGSAICHSKTPNFSCAPFFFSSKGIALSLVWPITDINVGDAITRNFLPRSFHGESDENFDKRLLVVSSRQGFDCSHLSVSSTVKKEQYQTMGTKSQNFSITNVPVNNSLDKKKIFCDFTTQKDLTNAAKKLGCSATSESEEADYILAVASPPTTGIKPGAKINHFTGEELLFKKSKLLMILEQCGRESCFIKRFCLLTQLSDFLREVASKSYSDYWVLHCEDSVQTNISPVVTSDVLRICRLIECGFTVASKFILQTPLYKEKKFALSYTIYISGENQKEVFVYNQPFIRETKQKCDALVALDEYDSSAYLTERPTPGFDSRTQQNFPDFISSMEKILEKSNLDQTWTNVQQKILEAIGDVINIVLSSISFENSSSFALFGMEFLLNADFKPIFLGFDQVPAISSAEMLEDLLSTVLCTNSVCGLPKGKLFSKICFP